MFLKHILKHWKAAVFTGSLAGMAAVVAPQWPGDDERNPDDHSYSEPEATKSENTGPVKLAFSDEFNDAEKILGTLGKHLPPLPSKEIMDDYAFAEGSIPLNPYLIKALEEDPKARDYLRMIRSACEPQGLDWRMCANQLFRESFHFNEDVINGTKKAEAGEVGFGQILPSTAEKYGIMEEELKDTHTSLALYAQIMADLREDYNGDMTLALIAYNGGPGAVDWIKSKLGDANASGEDAIALLDARYAELGSTSGNSYHVITREYVNNITGRSMAEDPKWTNGMNEKFNNGYFIAGLENEAHVLSALYPVAVIDENTPASSPRPVARPKDLADKAIQTASLKL